MTKTIGKKLSAKDRALALLASIITLIARDTRDRAQLEILIHALQAFKDGTLAHVYTRPTDLPDRIQRHRLFSVRFEDLAFLAPRLQKYLKRRGIRYVGEVFYVYFDPRSKTAGAHCDEILGALKDHLALPRETDPLMDGWTPPYWENPTFRQMLSTPVIQVLGDRSFNRAGRSFIGYTSTARWIHKGGDHYIGAWMQNLRAATSSKPGNPTNAWSAGKLEDLQTTLNRVPELWAAALIPPDWHAPEGVPEIWTHLLQTEILPAIAAEEERKRLVEVRQHTWSLWKQEQDRREEHFSAGEPLGLTVLLYDKALTTPLKDVCDTLWPDESTLHLARFEQVGVTTLAQLLQLTKVEITIVLNSGVAYASDVSYYYQRFVEWLFDQRLHHPVALTPQDMDDHPIPQVVLDHRARIAELNALLTADSDTVVANNSENLCKRVDELELSVRSANCLQNADVEYIWQLCQYTEGELLRVKNLGRKSLNEIKEILGELGLQLGMKFSKEALALLKSW